MHSWLLILLLIIYKLLTVNENKNTITLSINFIMLFESLLYKCVCVSFRETSHNDESSVCMKGSNGKQMIMGKIFGWVHFFCKWKRGLLCLSIRQLVTQERWFIAFFSSTYMFPFVRHFTFYHKFLLVHIKERIRAYLIW